MNDVAAVVVTYNRKDLLEQNLTTLLGQLDAACDVLVIDNCSTDGTAEMVKEKFDQSAVIYANTGSNLGGAGGFEVGIELAVELGYRYVWIMDDDTLPHPTALRELLKAGEDLGGNWGFLSSIAYWVDGSICRANEQKKNIFRRVRRWEYGDAPFRVEMASFVSLLVRTDVILDVGLPKGSYFIWTDDYEFSGRISQHYPCYMVPASKVTHAMSNHTRVDLATADEDRIDRFRYLYRNDVDCYRSYGFKGWAYILFKNGYTIANVIAWSKGNRLKKIRILTEGFKEGLRFDPGIDRVDRSKVSDRS